MVVFKYVAIVVGRFGVGDKRTENLIGAGFVYAVKCDQRMLLVVGELFIFGQVVKHLTIVSDVVSVDDDIGAR